MPEEDTAVVPSGSDPKPDVEMAEQVIEPSEHVVALKFVDAMDEELLCAPCAVVRPAGTLTLVLHPTVVDVAPPYSIRQVRITRRIHLSS